MYVSKKILCIFGFDSFDFRECQMCSMNIHDKVQINVMETNLFGNFKYKFLQLLRWIVPISYNQIQIQ